MLNLVFIDVICIVSFTVYGSTSLMWDCTYVLWVVEFKFVYYQLCFEFITPVFVHEMFFGECEPFFFSLKFEKGILFYFLAKSWTPQNSIFSTKYRALT